MQYQPAADLLPIQPSIRDHLITALKSELTTLQNLIET